ncbi:type 2 lantipeptide synthetase LanM [Mycobacterium kansasii]|nr:type 2 lantipeptide synthetase LanM [Mycobacterium kansasii]
MQQHGVEPGGGLGCAFEQLLMPVVVQAEARLWSAVAAPVAGLFGEGGRASLRRALVEQLSQLCAPALYALFDTARAGSLSYGQFVVDMRGQGFRRLFEAKPVLLRLMAVVTRQWIDASAELVVRLGADSAVISAELLGAPEAGRVARVEGGLGDLHNGGRSVHVVVFEDGTRIVYKPKDLRVDVAWCALVERLNAVAPVRLRAVRALARDGYGWTEFVEHAPCADDRDVQTYFTRAGAWLALFYCFAAGDMHQENIIAAGAHPVPIDIETILQPTMAEPADPDPESQAFRDALTLIADSAMSVGLLPSYERSPDNKIYASGGLVSNWNVKAPIRWTDINTDDMRPTRSTEAGKTTPNLPYLGGRYARFIDHLETFVAGFRTYARFLARWQIDTTTGGLLDGFAGLPVRTVARPTKFYAMLLARLHDHRSMDDGALWSAQADFVARLADWDKDDDPRWPLLQAERSALITLNVPFFLSASDGADIRDRTGTCIRPNGASGLQRASARVRGLDSGEIDWQVTVIRQNMASFVKMAALTADSGDPAPNSGENIADIAPTREMFVAEADRAAAELVRYAVRRGPSAAWIALDWSSDSDTFQLICLGHDLYNGVSGIALFLAAHAAVTGSAPSSELALAAVAHLRKEFRGGNAAPAARALGLGGGSGLGSIVYALAVMSKCLRDDALLADAHMVAALITDDLISADRQLDVMGGSAGAILGLLRLYRDTRCGDVLARAARCGEHLLGERRVGPQGRRSWSRPDSGKALNGISHGAAGFAYALAALAAATGREDFALAASECVAFENSSYDPGRHNWPDLRGDEDMRWPSQWCHGAPGIGLARIAMARLPGADTAVLTADIRNAAVAVESQWSVQLRDTLCCGALGSVEFLSQAGIALDQNDLRELAARRLAGVISAAGERGDYRWTAGNSRFNPGMFRGLAGVGYTALRQVDDSLPNVLVWE